MRLLDVVFGIQDTALPLFNVKLKLTIVIVLCLSA